LFGGWGKLIFGENPFYLTFFGSVKYFEDDD
jgi:hypothetical protein